MGSESKVCTKCGIEKPLSMYYRDGNKIRSDCIECRKDTVKLYRKNNLNKVKENCNKYRSSHREKLIEYLKQYRKNNKGTLAIKRKQKHLKNPDIRYQRDKEYRARHHDEIRLRYVKWMSTPSGKAAFARMRHRRLSHLNKTECTLTNKQWEKILKMQDNKCAGCGVLFSDNVKPARDHIIPLSLGGGLTFGNTQALCKSCNSKKKNKFDISKPLEQILVELK